ncbi:MAG: S8 family serine peptidase [Bdellovibrionota bacterium]|nr:S8 family serine peptidase [Bdellovibrionota bacterium]
MNKLALGAMLISFGLSAQAEKPAAVPGEYVVKLSQQAFEQETLNIQNELGMEVVRKISPQSKAVLVRDTLIRKADVSIRSLEAIRGVEMAEPNYIYTINRTPNDADFSKLWGLVNEGQVDPKGRQGIADADIDADKAWDITTGSRDVVVAVIDTGVDPTIPDLKNNMWVNEGEIPGNGIDDDNNGYVDDIHGYDFVNNDADPTDDHGHGSHCAGTIGAEGNNEIGVAGVAWNVRIMGVKFLSASGSGSLAAAISSIDYATSMGAQIQSNSWGGGGFSQNLKDAIVRSNEANSIFIAAAGNSNENNDSGAHYPSNYDVANVVSVAAINNSGERASFSNYGANTVHLGAPGRNIQSTIPGGYAAWSGTSMATPHVSGVAALVLSVDKELTGVEVKERLMNTVRPMAGMRGKTITGGVVNAYYAVTNQRAPADPNDPSNWDSVDYSLSSPHPYKDDFDQTWEVSVEGAEMISVHFSKFETENNYDKVFIMDAAGNVVSEMSGNNDGAFSAVVSGSSMSIRLVSDGSVSKYGFDIDKVAYK